MHDSLRTLGLILIIAASTFVLLEVVSPEKGKGKGKIQQQILVHKQGKVAAGPVLHTVRRTAKAWLVESDGTVTRQWHIKKYVPKQSKYTLRKSPLQHVEAAPDGSLLAVVKDSAVIRLDSNSELLSATEGFFHHDLDVLDDGTIVALERKPIEVSYQDINGTLLNDHLVMIGKDGSRQAEYPLFEVVSAFIPRDTVEHAFSFSASAPIEDIKNDTPADVLHTNSVEILRKDLPGIAPAGSALVSFRDLDLIAIVDFRDQEVLWSFGPGEISSQHAPTLLENGNILIFDNGRRAKTSRVIEVDPTTNSIVWQFDESHYDEPEFYSAARGSAQRLSNGNTLISVAERGKAIEVTPENEIVWKYMPQIRMKKKQGNTRRMRNVMIYRIQKIEDPLVYNALSGIS